MLIVLPIGKGVTREVGMDLVDLGAKNVRTQTDPPSYLTQRLRWRCSQTPTWRSSRLSIPYCRASRHVPAPLSHRTRNSQHHRTTMSSLPCMVWHPVIISCDLLTDLVSR